MGNVSLFNVYGVSSRTNFEWNNTEWNNNYKCTWTCGIIKCKKNNNVDILAYFWLHIQKEFSQQAKAAYKISKKKVMEKDNHWIGKIHFQILGQNKQITCVMEIIKINEPSAVLQV